MLPDQCDFIKPKDTYLFTVLNEMFYYVSLIALIVWFGKLCISRLQDACGGCLGTKNKCLLAVLSIPFVIHCLWPSLLFVTHFLACDFYPWATAIVAFLLNFYRHVSSLKFLPINISTYISFAKDYIGRIFSSRKVTDSTTVPISLNASRIPIRNETFPETHEASVIYPRISAQERHRESQTSAIQPDILSGGSSENSAMQSRLAVEETYRPKVTPKTKPRLEVVHDYHDRAALQPEIHAAENYVSPSVIMMHHQALDSRPRREEAVHHDNITEGIEFDSSGGTFDSGNSEPFRRDPCRHLFKDFSQQVNFIRSPINTRAPQNTGVNGSRRTYLANQISQINHNGDHCERCGKMKKLPFRPDPNILGQIYTTRLGTAFGPTNIFCHCTRLKNS